MKIRETNNKDLPLVSEVFAKEWSGEFIVSRGKKHYPKDLLGFIAEDNGEKLGLLTYEVVGDQIELISLNSFKKIKGLVRL